MITLDSLTAAPALDRQQRRYNATDAAVTLELQQRHLAAMTPAARSHFNLLMRLHDPLLDMQLRGLRWHSALARQLEAEAATEYWEAYARLADTAGVAPPASDAALLPLLEPFCQKRLWPQVLAGTRGCVDAALGNPDDNARVRRVWQLCQHGYGSLPAAARGELLFLLGLVVNVDSAPALCDWLYNATGLALPPQYNDEGNLTAGADALLALLRKAPDNRRRDAIRAILRIRHLAGRLEVLRAGTDPDGRVRCAYNPVGTVTGRLACYTSPTGSGFNLQTLTESLRRLVIADDGMLMAQCDLKGADGWTVACWSAALGDPTMLMDLQNGIKPAQLLARGLEAGDGIMRETRLEVLRAECAKVGKSDWRYIAGKPVQHGSTYGMGVPTMQRQIVEASYKQTGEPVFIEQSVLKELQRLFFVRYPGIKRWHARTERLLQESGRMTMSTGHTRTFYGRKKDIATRNEALAEEPQHMTTHANNTALLRGWDDHRPLLTPQHHMHDSLNWQFRVAHKEAARIAIRECFNNPVTIAGITLVIPFEGGIGTSWGELGEKL